MDVFAASAAESTHLRREILSARHGGRVSLMGGIKGGVALPLAHVMHANITINGKWTYERDDMLKLNKLVESRRSRVDGGSAKKYVLKQWRKPLRLPQAKLTRCAESLTATLSTVLAISSTQFIEIRRQ